MQAWPSSRRIEIRRQYTVIGREPSTADPTASPELVLATADGYIRVGTISDSERRGFCAASERPDLMEDPRFDTPRTRAVNAAEHPTAEWLQRFDPSDVASAPVLRRGE